MTDSHLGQLLALMSATSFAIANVFIVKGATGSGDRGVMFSVLVTILFSGALWLVAEGGSMGQAVAGDWYAGIAWFALAGLLAMVFGRSLVYASIAYLGATRASAVKRLNPFFSVFLAYIFLAEPITGWDGLGMVLIALAFALLIMRTQAAGGLDVHETKLSPIDYSWGVGAALAYAFAYIARKQGLADIGAPAFGTMISAVSGFGFFLLAALIWRQYRDNLRNIFRNLNRWLFLASIMVSFGQIFTFSALYYEKISTVVMISSLEIFLSAFLSVVVFRAERQPGAGTYIAALLATLGVIAVAFG